MAVHFSYQKKNFFRWISIGSIFCLLIFQFYALYSTYQGISDIINRSIDEAFTQSVKGYRSIAMQKFDESIELIINDEENKDPKEDFSNKEKLNYKGKDILIDDVMYKAMGLIISKDTINTFQLDSLFSAQLETRKLDIPFEIVIYESKKDSFFVPNDKTYSTPLKELDIRRNVQAFYENPMHLIFQKMWGFLVFSIILIGLIIFALVYQLRIITRQKKIEKVRQDFVDSMTHELKHPLQGALSLSEILENPSLGDNPELRKSVILKIKQNLYNLNQSLESILEKSYSENLQHSAHWERGNIIIIIEEILANFVLTSSKKIHFSTNFEVSQPLFYFDKTHLPNAIKNLIDNAIKYSSQDVYIEISVKEENQNLWISVRDKGIGIRPENLKSIFEKFYRVENKKYGFGLGLSYVKWVAELHQGSVNVESMYGKGSVFTLCIPLMENPLKDEKNTNS
ncbi:HAMP domain-containing histidine kinase [Weeksellaceae bacterium TAE3-ERU29]|nr:HAMP domain-containing histidine kinase [Weeksellaceae bacterium TAE3-ERU29]